MITENTTAPAGDEAAATVLSAAQKASDWLAESCAGEPPRVDIALLATLGREVALRTTDPRDALIQRMQRALMRVTQDWRGNFDEEFEDGEMPAMDAVRAVLADVPEELRPVGYVLRWGALEMGVAEMEVHDTLQAAQAAGDDCDFNYEVLPVFRSKLLGFAPAEAAATAAQPVDEQRLHAVADELFEFQNIGGFTLGGMSRDGFREVAGSLIAAYLAAPSAATAAQQQPSTPLWCLHIPGPDDLHAAPSNEEAVKAAAAYNAYMRSYWEKRAAGLTAEQIDHYPAIESYLAHVVPWPWEPAGHAESVKDWKLADWLPKGGPQGASQADQAAT